MIYLTVNKNKSKQYGIGLIGHKSKGELMIVNENEIWYNSKLKGDTLEDRSKNIDGEIYTFENIKNIIKEGGWS